MSTPGSCRDGERHTSYFTSPAGQVGVKVGAGEGMAHESGIYESGAVPDAYSDPESSTMVQLTSVG